MARGIWVDGSAIKKIWVDGSAIKKVWVGTELVWTSEPEWGAWSGWSTTPVTANDNRQVETKTQHTYQTYGDYATTAQKIFKDCWTGSQRITDCDKRNCRPAGSLWAYQGDWVNNRGKYNCHGGYSTTTTGWGYNGTLDAVSGWVDGAGSTTSTYRVVSTQTLYRYRDNLNQ